MNEIYEHFVDEFKNINKKGWIMSCDNSLIGIGVTFENELGKTPDSLYLPDYKGIEIKCCQRYSGYPLNLFSKSLDGPYLFSTNEFLQKFGSLNEEYEKKESFIDLYCNKFTEKNGYNFKLYIDKINKKIFIDIYDSKINFVEREFYVDFSSLEKIINIKFKSLAYIKASKKVINDIKYFRYYSLDLLELKSFDCFIDLLEKDLINCSFIGRVSKTDFCKGKNKNKGLHFSIDKDKIHLLFNSIYSFNSDKYNNDQIITNIFD